VIITPRNKPSPGVWHIMPHNDMREHDPHMQCWCHPRLEWEDDTELAVHNSMDGREAFESGERKMS
jgi:hypothetical protein